MSEPKIGMKYSSYKQGLKNTQKTNKYKVWALIKEMEGLIQILS